MTQQEVTIVNEQGLHARPAAKFVQVASRFDSDIKVAKAGRLVDGRSIMGLMTLTARQDSSIVISADGPDEVAAVKALVQLVGKGFGDA